MKKYLLRSTAIARAITPIAFMSETVIIETENGPVMIEKSDYDPAKHTLDALNGTIIPTPEPTVPVANPIVPPNGPPAIPEPAHNTTPAGGASAIGLQANAPQTPNTPDPVLITDPEIIARISAMNFAVVTTGKGKAAKYFIVDMVNGGKPVEDVPGIDKDGYASNKAAWDALYLVQLSVGITPGA